MSQQFEYDVFLSHNSSHKPAVESLAKRLIDEAKLRPFLDKWHLIPGVAWQSELADALQGIKTVAVLIGPLGNGPWHDRARESITLLAALVTLTADFVVMRVLSSTQRGQASAWL